MTSPRQIGGLDPAEARASLAPWQHTAAPIAADEYQRRIERARTLLRQQGIDALLITAGTSLRYFTGVPWGASERLVGMLLTARGEPIVVCPGFEAGSLKPVLRIPADVRLWEEHEDPQQLVADALREGIGLVAPALLDYVPEPEELLFVCGEPRPLLRAQKHTRTLTGYG